MRSRVRPHGSAILVSTARRRWAAWAACAACCLALVAVGTRIAFGARIDSDGANNALQAWDMVHGHPLLPGWHLGDLTFVTFELPVIGITQLVLGFGPAAVHVAAARLAAPRLWPHHAAVTRLDIRELFVPGGRDPRPRASSGPGAGPAPSRWCRSRPRPPGRRCPPRRRRWPRFSPPTT